MAPSAAAEAAVAALTAVAVRRSAALRISAAEADEPVHPPAVHEQLFAAGLVHRHDRFACLSLNMTITLVLNHQL